MKIENVSLILDHDIEKELFQVLYIDKKSIEEKMKRIAICYDFDKTLTPLDMQSQGFVQDIGMSIDEFWEEVDSYSVDEHMELNLTYMYKMLHAAKRTGKSLTKDYLYNFGKNIEYFDGLDTWFERINSYGEEKGVEVHHYILSSGLKEIIDGTSIVKYFDKVYASSFHYDENGYADWPGFVVNYTNKTQFLFRISKGVFDELDDGVNAATHRESYYVPFTNFIYIGDSDTDIPCMTLMAQFGGLAIGVYHDNDKKMKVEKLARERRIKAAVKADYTENSKIEKIIKEVIDNISSKD